MCSFQESNTGKTGFDGHLSNGKQVIVGIEADLEERSGRKVGQGKSRRRRRWVFQRRKVTEKLTPINLP